MTPTDAEDLAVRICATWPGHGTPTAGVWVDALATLDRGTAGTAYARLRAEADKPPTVARFLAVYKSLHTARSGDRDSFAIDCDVCDDTGWREVTDPATGRVRGVAPCRCTRGDAMVHTHRQILDANGHGTTRTAQHQAAMW